MSNSTLASWWDETKLFSFVKCYCRVDASGNYILDAKGNQVWGSTKGAYRFVKEAAAPARRPDPEMPLGTEASVAPGETTAMHPPMPGATAPAPAEPAPGGTP